MKDSLKTLYIVLFILYMIIAFAVIAAGHTISQDTTRIQQLQHQLDSSNTQLKILECRESSYKDTLLSAESCE